MNIETMRLLVAKGLSAADILEVAETMGGATVRSAGAERQARYRARRAQRDVIDDVTSDVTRDGNEVTDPALSRPPNENNSNPPTHTHPDMVIPPARKVEPFPCPDWADAGVWRDLRANRKRKRLADTATAHRKFLTDLMALVDDDWPPGRLLEAIVARGWGAAYDPRETRHDRSANDRSPADQGLPARRGAGWDRRTGFERAADEHGGLRGN